VQNLTSLSRLRELEASLEGERASRRMFQVNRTSDTHELEAEFDPEDSTPFDDRDAGRKQFSRAMEAINACSLKECLSRRGSRGDEFEPALRKHVIHRPALSRQKAASLAFERDRRPRHLSLDVDFAETSRRRARCSRSTGAPTRTRSSWGWQYFWTGGGVERNGRAA
jgi:hypothetical protein